MRSPGFAAALLFAAVSVVGAPVWTATPAAAHDQLISSTPEDGGTLTELPNQIVLEFNNELIDAAPALLIRDAADTTVHQTTPAVDGRFATAGFPELGDGTYRLAWSVVSSDGHRIEGFMPFTLDTGRPAGSAPAPGTPPADETTEAASPGAETPDAGGLSTPVKVVIGLGGVGAVAMAAAVVMMRARRGGFGQ